MIRNHVNKELKEVPDWLLGRNEIDEIGLDVNFDDSEAETSELTNSDLDIVTYAMSGNVSAVIRQSQIYLAMAKRYACQAKGDGAISRIDQNSNETKDVIVSALNVAIAYPDKLPSEILRVAIERNGAKIEDLAQYKRVKGSRLIKEVVELSELSELQRHQLVIHPTLTVLGLIGQVKKVCGYLPVRLRKRCKSQSIKCSKQERHLKILSYKKQGMTQRKAASLIGVSERTIKRFWNRPLRDS